MPRLGWMLAVVVSLWMMAAVPAAAHKVELRDDCDPTDPAWFQPPGPGCALEEGDVTRAEFDAEAFSPLGDEPVGHQAWRNDPAYLKIHVGETVQVKNKGGRNHTFTKVAAFGGGTVTGLNGTLAPAPECASAPNLPPGGKTQITGLEVGLHRIQCCRHPWMRTHIQVLD
jgi:plastocyanin